MSWVRPNNWEQMVTVLDNLNDKINWALETGALNVFAEASNYRAELLAEFHRYAQQELALIDTAEDIAS